MSDHDPLCVCFDSSDPLLFCECDTIDKTRADERERIAQAIKAQAETYDPSECEARWAYRVAAGIARGGRDA